jgi:hypothetical protein
MGILHRAPVLVAFAKPSPSVSTEPEHNLVGWHGQILYVISLQGNLPQV